MYTNSLRWCALLLLSLLLYVHMHVGIGHAYRMIAIASTCTSTLMRQFMPAYDNICPCAICVSYIMSICANCIDKYVSLCQCTTA